jgi:cytochrome c oxidase assembly protein subunit 15
MNDSPSRHAIANWLFLCCVLIFAMVVLGGVTRLTGSGLSIVEWGPIMGTVPPLSDSDWQSAFTQYQQFPEYQKKNFGMSLDDFKAIFWFEYAHRLLGRAIGVVFLLPFLYFLLRRRIPRGMTPQLLGLFLLGGLQGALGWYMVQSGLVNDPQVSQYRLTAHLAMAFLIYGAMFWVGLNVLHGPPPDWIDTDPSVRRKSALTLFMIVVTIISGGFVAGLKAGFAYNTFPLMDGRFIPAIYGMLEPVWRNPFENIAAVQFNHRWLGILTMLIVIGLWLLTRRRVLGKRARLGVNLLLVMVLIQVTLGISTLLLHVPIPLAATHQGGALLLFTLILFTLHSLRYR